MSSERRTALRADRERFEPAKIVSCDADDLSATKRVLAELVATNYGRARLYIRSGADLRAEIELDPRQLDADDLAQELVAKWGRPREISLAIELPRVSVVVCTIMKRLDSLATLLESLASLDYPDYEIILVDNRPATDSDESPVVERGRIRVVRQPIPGVAAARNRGIQAATGEIIAFTDDDARVETDWLTRLVAPFAADADTAVVTGIGLPSELETEAQQWFEEYYGGFSGGFEAKTFALADRRGRRRRSVRSVVDERTTDGRLIESRPILIAAGSCGVGVNMAFRRRVLDEMGPFDERLGAGTSTRGGEEIFAFARVLWNGHKIRYEPRARVWHTHRRTYDELAQQVAGTGVSITATLTALALHDARLAGCLVAGTGVPGRVVRAVISAVRGPATDAAETPITYPAELRKLEVRGMLSGPGAYFGEWRRRRRPSWQ